MNKKFREELISLLSKHSKENGSDTPNIILAEYLVNCLNAFDRAVVHRTEWYDESDEPYNNE